MIEGYKGDPTNNQEVFDYIWDFITKQACKAISSTGSCKYRVPVKNLCCAAGCLIPDEDYDPKMESYGIGFEIDSFPSNYFRSKNYNLILLYQCQHAHDNVDIYVENYNDLIFVENFQKNMRKVAQYFTLKTPE